MLQSAADIAAMHAAVGDLVTPAVGGSFYGVLGVQDVDQFDLMQAGAVTLRYPAAAVVLTEGALLTIDGTQYRVVEPPQRIADGHELVARLGKV